jgi:hypothetical protein
MLLLYFPADARPTPEESAAMMPKWDEYTTNLRDHGVFVAGDALQGVELATTVRARDGEIQVTDGPFAETREMLGGFYMIDVPDLDTALSYAERVPNVHFGSVEVRPIWDTTQSRADAAAGANATA